MTIGAWMIYALWAVLGFMLLDLVVGFVKALVTGTFSSKLVLDYLKDVLYYVFPLLFVMNIMSIDPTGWILMIFYYIGSLAVIWNYLVSIKNKWKA